MKKEPKAYRIRYTFEGTQLLSGMFKNLVQAQKGLKAYLLRYSDATIVQTDEEY